MKILIRFNTDYPENSNQKWRLIVDNYQLLVDEIEVKCESKTSSDWMGNILKHHVSCDANSFTITEQEDKSKVATIN